MLFKPEHIDLIIAGRKTQTRRICRPGERSNHELGGPDAQHLTRMVEDGRISSVLTASDRVKWEVLKTYAVQPGRGKPGAMWGHWHDGRAIWDLPNSETSSWTDDWTPLRIRLLDIRQERLQDISQEDARVEGYPENEDERECPHCNALYPTGWYDGPDLPCICDPIAWYRELWDAINTRPGTRWADAPLVWALTFEVVRE
jgi:hypothetical protein